jgi:hypothetical protein
VTPHFRRLLLLLSSLGVQAALGLAMSGLGWAMGLATSGIPSDYQFDCSNLTLSKAQVVGVDDHWYQFEGSCIFKTGPGTGFDSISVIVHAKWKEGGKKAMEKLLFQSESGGWIDTTAVCGADPWLNHATTCSGSLSSPSDWILHFLGQARVSGKDAPLTRTLADVQAATKVNVPAGQTPPPAPTKVTILSPAKNQVVVGDHVLVTTNWPVTFSKKEAGQSLCMINFQWWQLTVSADGYPTSGVVPVMGFIETLADCIASAGLSYPRIMLRDLLYDRKLAPLEAGGKGEWRISVGKIAPSGVTTDLQLLSDWRNFTIADPTYQFDIVRDLQRRASASDAGSRSEGGRAPEAARDPALKDTARGTPDESSRAGAVPPAVSRESPVAGGRASQARVIVAAIVPPSSPVKTGRVGTLFVQVQNTGLGKGGSPVGLSVKCRAVSGGPCPIDERVQPLPRLEAGQMVTVALRGKRRAAPGVYTVSVQVLPGAAGGGKSIDLTVE